MPTYEYACSACGHAWEQVQRITEAPIEVCPKCAASAAHRLISGGTNFILKGGGWYSDLYSSPKGTTKEAKEPDAKADTPSSTPAKADGSTSTGTTAAASSTPAPTTPSTPSTPSS